MTGAKKGQTSPDREATPFELPPFYRPLTAAIVYTRTSIAQLPLHIRNLAALASAASAAYSHPCCLASLVTGIPRRAPEIRLEVLREAKPGGFQTGGFPTFFFGKGPGIVPRTLSGLFLLGAVNRPRKRKRTNRENPRTIPEQIGKIPKKIGKVPKRTKKDKKGRTSPDRETPPFSGPGNLEGYPAPK